MIRVLKNADFSNCGLGRVDLQIPTSEQADTIVGKFPNISAENEAKLRRFIDTLVYYGVYDKLLYLAIPEVASSESEAIQNVLIDRATTLLTGNTALVSGKGLLVGDGTAVSYLSNGTTYPVVGTGITNADLVSNRVRGNFSFGVYIEYPESGSYNSSAICASKNISGNSNYAHISFSYVNTPGLLSRLSSNDSVTYAQGSLNGSDNKAIQIICENITYEDNTSVAAKCITLNSEGVLVKENGELVKLPEDLSTPRQLFGDMGSNRFRGYFKVMFEGKFLDKNEVLVMRDAILNLFNTNID